MKGAKQKGIKTEQNKCWGGGVGGLSAPLHCEEG